MSFLRRIFGPVEDTAQADPVVRDGHVHAPDAHPDDVVLPKRKRSSTTLLAGAPPVGWQRHSVKASGGIWPWGGGDGHGGNAPGADGGGSSSGGGSGGGE